MDYKPAIIAAAVAAGIEPAIALAVARQESGIQQYWQKDGKARSVRSALVAGPLYRRLFVSL